MRGEYALGKFLKSRYVEEYKLLNATYILKEVRQYSSCLWANTIRWTGISVYLTQISQSEAISTILISREIKPMAEFVYD